MVGASLRFILAISAATLAVLASQGFDFPISNNVFHVPIVLDYAGSAEGPNDAFHLSLARFASGLWPALSLVATEGNLAALFLTVHLAGIAFLFFAILRIASDSVSESGAIVLSAFLPFLAVMPLLQGVSPIGRNEIVINYLSHSQAVIPFVLISLFLMMRGRPIWSALTMGAAFNLNAFVAVWGAVMLAVAAIGLTGRAGWRAQVGLLFRMGVAFNLASLPTGIWIASTMFVGEAGEPFDFIEYLRAYYPHHTFIDGHLSVSLTAMLFLAACAPMFPLIGDRLPRTARTALASFFGAGLAIVVLGVGLPYLANSRLLLNLYPLRMDAYVLLFALLACLIWLGSAFSRDDAASRGAALLGLLSFAIGAPVMLALAVLAARPDSARLRAFVTAIIAAAAGVTFGFGEPVLVVPDFSVKLLFFVALQAAVIACFFSGAGMPLYRTVILLCGVAAQMLVGGEGAVATGVFYGALAAAVAFRRVEIVGVALLAAAVAIYLQRPAAWWFLAYPIIGIVLLTHVLAARWDGVAVLMRWSRAAAAPALCICAFALAAYFYMGRGGLCGGAGCHADRVAAEAWARENTAPGAVFLPVDVDGFSTLSRRPVWVDWKIGAMVMWAPETHDLWRSRYARLSSVETTDAAFSLAWEEGIEYLVFSNAWLAERDDAPCMAYRNDMFTIARSTCD